MDNLHSVPYELLVAILGNLTAHDDYALSRVALTSRLLSEAANEVLYRGVALDTERRLILFSGLLNLDSPRSPLRLVRHLSVWTDYVGWEREQAGRIIDACPNLRSVQARAFVVTQYCKTRCSFDTAFVWMVAADWDRFLRCDQGPRTGMDFTRTTRLHVHWLDYLRFSDRPLNIFTAGAFPRLRFFSGGLNVNLGNKDTLTLFTAISYALLALPAVERILYVVHREQIENCLALRACCPEDGRLCVKVHDCAGDAALTVWLDHSRGDRDIWHSGVPLLHLKSQASCQSPPICRNLTSPAMQGACRHPSVHL
ncbi:hypothetical protein AURDEDRAFT_168075 [Auricularia subglabra TFB-10046 SS5]|nr:hypothetical protein AURDEDRAFT_168075 [Auricularia subglabra TFB-10046 SS5]